MLSVEFATPFCRSFKVQPNLTSVIGELGILLQDYKWPESVLREAGAEALQRAAEEVLKVLKDRKAAAAI